MLSSNDTSPENPVVCAEKIGSALQNPCVSLHDDMDKRGHDLRSWVPLDRIEAQIKQYSSTMDSRTVLFVPRLLHSHIVDWIMRYPRSSRFAELWHSSSETLTPAPWELEVVQQS